MNPTASYVRSDRLAAHAPRHGFSTRLGGVSGPPWDALNLGYHQGDSEAHVDANHAQLMGDVGLGGCALATATQVHGDGIFILSSPRRLPHVVVLAPPEPGGALTPGEGDALITDAPHVAVGVRTADCTPILLASRGGGVVAAIHAGWRGTAAGIALRVVRVMSQAFDLPADRLFAAVGPCIGLASYQVGGDVAQGVARSLGAEVEALPSVCVPDGDGKWRVDLAEANRLQLIEAGIPDGHVEVLGLDTLADPRRFFSHRRDRGVTGRHLNVIAPGGGDG